MTKDCYHCGDPVPQGCQHQVEILGKTRDMCCPGCEAVAQTIVESGLSSYYEFRTAPAEKADLIPQQLQSLLLYDHEEIQQEFVREFDDSKEVSLSLDGVSCAACAWLIEKQLKREVGGCLHSSKHDNSPRLTHLGSNQSETKPPSFSDPSAWL